MKCYKDKNLIIFDFENGKKASYNMNTGETIGKMGNPVKTLCSALAGYDIDTILDSFENKKYGEFLRYILENKTPHIYSGYWRSQTYSSRVTNLGTLLRYANNYKTYEQYFIADVKANDCIRTPLTEVPKGLLKLCREYNKTISDQLIRTYKEIPNEYNVAFSMEFESITKTDIWDIMHRLAPSTYGNANKLLKEFNYDLKALLKYIDYLRTFEAVNSYALVTEIGDYANMMHTISKKFEKYPRYFLSTHKIAARNYERLKQQFEEDVFASRIKPQYNFKYKDFVFIYPKTTQDIKDEAVQQSNCVASYIKGVIDGNRDIIFLRKADEPEKSLVTVEVRNGKIVQALQRYNNPCTPEQQEAIAAFNKKFGNNTK